VSCLTQRGWENRKYPLSLPGAIPAAALEEWITRVRVLNMEEVHRLVEARSRQDA